MYEFQALFETACRACITATFTVAGSRGILCGLVEFPGVHLQSILQAQG